MKLSLKLGVPPKYDVFLMLLGFVFFGWFCLENVSPLYGQTKVDSPVKKEEIRKSSLETTKSSKRAKNINVEALRMMEKIEVKTKELKKREEQIEIRENQLKTLEEKVKGDLKKVEAALKKSKELMNISTDLREEKINSLVKIYSAMKPDDAAPLVAALDEKIAIQILSKMKSKIAGQVMGKLDTKAAKKLSERIVGVDIFAKDKK